MNTSRSRKVYSARGPDRSRLAALVSSLTAAIAYLEPFYFLDQVRAHAPLYDFAAPWDLLRETLWRHPGPIVLAAAGYRARSRTKSLLVMYLVLATVEGLMLSVRWGSDFNYFLSSVAALAILAGAGADQLVRATARWSPVAPLSIGITAGVLLVWQTAASENLEISKILKGELSCVSAACVPDWDPRALKILNSVRGPILTDVPEFALVADVPQVWHPEFDVLRAMHDRGIFDDAELLTAIRKRRVALIALNYEWLDREYRGRTIFWPKLQQTIQANYVPVPSVGPPYLMAPRSASGDEGQY